VDPWQGVDPRLSGAASHPAVGVATLAPGAAELGPVALAPPDKARRTDPSLLLAGAYQVVLLLWAYALYDVLRVGAAGTLGTATAHADHVVAVERFLGLHVERIVQRAAMQWSLLVGACNLCYSLTHIVVPPLVLWLLYRRAPARYRQWRNIFFVVLVIGVVCFWLYPTGPPRLVAGSGVLDTSHGYVSEAHTPLASVSGSGGMGIAGSNPFAAMPSLHVAWALWAALALWPVLRRRSSRLLVASYPVVMFVTVIVTGNHWVLDAIAGVATALLAWGIVTVVTSAWQRRSTTGYRPL
jgi:PAP2 superfamily